MRKITECLNPTLSSICKRAIELESLTAIVHRYLPTQYHTICRVSHFNKGCLVLLVDDPVWSAQMRFILPELRDKLRTSAGLYQLITIKIQNATLNIDKILTPN